MPRTWRGTEYSTHRCKAMPDGFSLRRYEPDGNRHQWPEPGGWVLAFTDVDDESMEEFCNPVTPWRWQHVRHCPWCGEEL